MNTQIYREDAKWRGRQRLDDAFTGQGIPRGYQKLGEARKGFSLKSFRRSRTQSTPQFWTCSLQSCKTINFCCLKPSSLWSSVTAVLRSEYNLRVAESHGQFPFFVLLDVSAAYSTSNPAPPTNGFSPGHCALTLPCFPSSGRFLLSRLRRLPCSIWSGSSWGPAWSQVLSLSYPTVIKTTISFTTYPPISLRIRVSPLLEHREFMSNCLFDSLKSSSNSVCQKWNNLPHPPSWVWQKPSCHPGHLLLSHPLSDLLPGLDLLLKHFIFAVDPFLSSPQPRGSLSSWHLSPGPLMQPCPLLSSVPFALLQPFSIQQPEPSQISSNLCPAENLQYYPLVLKTTNKILKRKPRTLNSTAPYQFGEVT